MLLNSRNEKGVKNKKSLGILASVMKTFKRTTLFAALFILVSTVFHSEIGAANGKAGVIYKESTDSLTVTARDVPAEEIFREFADKAGVEVLIGEGVDSKISASFEDIPLEEGTRKLLRGLNHGLIFDEKGRLVSVRIFPEGKGGFVRTGPSMEEIQTRREERRQAQQEARTKEAELSEDAKAHMDAAEGRPLTFPTGIDNAPGAPEDNNYDEYESIPPGMEPPPQKKRNRIGPPKKGERRKERKKGRRNAREVVTD